jgi:hypothetical protein
VLTGSAIALTAYLGASSNDTGHDGRGARQTGLAAALTASHQAQATGTLDAITVTHGTGFGTGLESRSTTHMGGTTSTPGPMATYGTAPAASPPAPTAPSKASPQAPPETSPEAPRGEASSRTQARARRHRGGLHGNPWQIAGLLMPAYHWTSWQFHYLNLLWMRESGWNRFAYNHSSGAYGIPQAVPGDKMAAARPDWRTSARTQIIWGMGYIRSRYGDPWNAWQHELRYGWY